MGINRHRRVKSDWSSNDHKPRVKTPAAKQRSSVLDAAVIIAARHHGMPDNAPLAAVYRKCFGEGPIGSIGKDHRRPILVWVLTHCRVSPRFRKAAGERT